MAQILNETLAQMEYDQLLKGGVRPVDTFGIDLKAGQGLLERGTVLAPDETDGSMVILGEDTTGTANCILCDDVDTGTSASADSIPAVAYSAGEFLLNRLIVEDDYVLSDEDVESLRIRNIILYDGIGFE